MRPIRLIDELIYFGIVYLCLLLLLTSCATLETAQADTCRPRGLRGSVNGQRFEGTAVIKPAEVYDIKVESAHDVGLFVLSSCHRAIEVVDPINVDFFHRQKSFTYRYEPARGLEDQGSCLLRIGVHSEGISSWAVLDFITPEASLPALNMCNGINDESSGVSVCQARAGLIQMLEFETEVIILQHSEQRCGVALQGDGRIFQYAQPDGECVWAVMEKNKPHRVHRHTSIGYRE